MFGDFIDRIYPIEIEINRVLLPKLKGDNSGHVIIKMKQNDN
jgi:hypothetical protein